MADESQPQYIIRNMKKEDFKVVNDICKELFFMMGKYENDVMMNIDCDGLFVAEEIGTGNILGTCCGIIHSQSFAFIGHYAVRREYQGKGIGKNIWHKVIEHIGSERNISLFSYLQMVPKYRDEWGFVLTPERKSIEYCGIANCDRLIKHIDHITIVQVNDNNLKNLIEYDKKICDGLSRDIFLKQYTKTPETIFLAAINERKEIMGFGIMTKCISGIALLLPLYADTKEIAEFLIVKCCELMPIALTNGILLQTFDCNKNATELALKMNLKPKNVEPLLFTKKIINGDLQRIYSISTAGFYPF